MSEKEMYNLLATLNIPVAYDHFKKKQAPPFIAFRNNDTTIINSDDKVLWMENEYIIDLVTELKSPTTEQLLETLLNNNYMPFTKFEDFIESEQIYQIRYYV